jgi:hypothetical protein
VMRNEGLVCASERYSALITTLYSRISAAEEVIISFRIPLYDQLTDHYCPHMPHVGVESDTARAYVSSFYASLAASTVSSPASFEGENCSNPRLISSTTAERFA